MILKIDLENTYDRLDWGFLRAVLSAFNFTPKWINLI